MVGLISWAWAADDFIYIYIYLFIYIACSFNDPIHSSFSTFFSIFVFSSSSCPSITFSSAIISAASSNVRIPAIIYTSLVVKHVVDSTVWWMQLKLVCQLSIPWEISTLPLGEPSYANIIQSLRFLPLLLYTLKKFLYYYFERHWKREI